jgi:hypothetical protein
MLSVAGLECRPARTRRHCLYLFADKFGTEDNDQVTSLSVGSCTASSRPGHHVCRAPPPADPSPCGRPRPVGAISVWDALHVEGKVNAGTSETLRVLWDRWAEVDMLVLGLKIVYPQKRAVVESVGHHRRNSAERRGVHFVIVGTYVTVYTHAIVDFIVDFSATQVRRPGSPIPISNSASTDSARYLALLLNLCDGTFLRPSSCPPTSAHAPSPRPESLGRSQAASRTSRPSYLLTEPSNVKTMLALR